MHSPDQLTQNKTPSDGCPRADNAGCHAACQQHYLSLASSSEGCLSRLVRRCLLASTGAEVKGAMSRWTTGKEIGLSTFLVAPLSVALKRFMWRHSTGGSWRMDICFIAALSHSHLQSLARLGLPSHTKSHDMSQLALASCLNCKQQMDVLHVQVQQQSLTKQAFLLLPALSRRCGHHARYAEHLMKTGVNQTLTSRCKCDLIWTHCMK